MQAAHKYPGYLFCMHTQIYKNTFKLELQSTKFLYKIGIFLLSLK